MDLKDKARRMRLAINDIEGALFSAPGLVDLPEKWGDPRHRSELGCKPEMDCGQVYRITDALTELNRIVNDPDYNIHNFE